MSLGSEKVYVCELNLDGVAASSTAMDWSLGSCSSSLSIASCKWISAKKTAIRQAEQDPYTCSARQVMFWANSSQYNWPLFNSDGASGSAGGASKLQG